MRSWITGSKAKKKLILKNRISKTKRDSHSCPCEVPFNLLKGESVFLSFLPVLPSFPRDLVAPQADSRHTEAGQGMKSRR